MRFVILFPISLLFFACNKQVIDMPVKQIEQKDSELQDSIEFFGTSLCMGTTAFAFGNCEMWQPYFGWGINSVWVVND